MCIRDSDNTTHGGRSLLNQMTLGAIGTNLLADTLDLEPVSYTHLDVYKRQS